jgi:DNA (cytosine-5)-methyltransferase 1
MTRPVLLDLFCGAGGAAMGYHRAGFDVVGVDWVPQPDYPFTFVRADASTFPLDGFDAVHASPPCKLFTALRVFESWRPQQRLFDIHDDQLTPMLARLGAVAVPWVVENVPRAPMPANAVTVCGSAFGLRVRRHRLFASNMPLVGTSCDHARQGQAVGVYGHGGAWTYRDKAGGRHGVKVAGGEAAAAMGINWTTDQRALSQAIPPAYTEWIGTQLLAVVDHDR